MQKIAKMFFLLALIPAFTMAAPKEEEPLPIPTSDAWAFRKHYTIKLGNGAFDYAEDTGEWRIFSSGKVVISNASFSIVLGDGRTLTGETLGEAESARSQFDSPYGAGTHYTLKFPPQDGVQVTHQLTSFKTRPFVLIEVSVTNTGAVPLVVKEVNPAIISAAGFQMGAGTTQTAVPIHARDGFIVPSPQEAPLMRFWQDAAGQTGVALGLLAQGRARAGLDFEPSGDAWAGRAFNLHEPGFALAQNETLSSDALWCTYAETDFDAANLYYAWTINSNPHQTYDKPIPQGWLTVSEGASLNDLVAHAGAAQSAGLKFALIPGGWESRLGSLDGAAPRYPRQIAAAARQLKDAGLIAGLTVDPLAFSGGEAGWSTQSQDGQSWLNLSKPEARAFVEERVQGLQRNGFDFFVVSRSTIPDDVLLAFNLSRAAADSLAVQTAAGAAAGAPVFPSAEIAVDATDAFWVPAQQRLKPLGDFKVVFAPIRVSFSHGGEISAQNIAALKEWPGPLEVMDAPPQGVRSSLRALFQQPPGRQ